MLQPGGETEQKLLMHEAGRGKMIFEDCIPLCSILSSSEALLCDSLLSATKNRFSHVEATVCQALRRGTAQHCCSDRQSSELADNTRHSPRKQVEKVEISFWC